MITMKVSTGPDFQVGDYIRDKAARCHFQSLSLRLEILLSSWVFCNIFEVFLGTCDIGMMRQRLAGKVMFFCNLMPGFHHFDLLLVFLSLAESYCDYVLNLI